MAHTRTTEADVNGTGLSCLECGAGFDVEDVNAARTSARDRCYLVCVACGARNEIRSEPMPGPGAPPAAVVLRVVHG